MHRTWRRKKGRKVPDISRSTYSWWKPSADVVNMTPEQRMLKFQSAIGVMNQRVMEYLGRVVDNAVRTP
jgi:hypothetical protein